MSTRPTRPGSRSGLHGATTRGGSTTSTSSGRKRWYLESHSVGRPGADRIAVDRFPFRVGRGSGLDLTLSSASVSTRHAELYVDAGSGKLHVRDLRSTNGTFVNRKRIQDVVLSEGDIVHFADAEFRLASDDAESRTSRRSPTRPLGSNHELPHNFVHGTMELMELIRDESIVPMFQSIVCLEDRSVAGYEVLTRGGHPDLPEGPNELFEIAAGLGLEPELSRLFRKKALDVIRGRDDLPILFLNTHPEEREDDLLAGIPDIRAAAPHQRLILEIHEQALAHPESIRRLREALDAADIGLAFDDFGAGQARLVQLAEVPPDFLKFDISFVKGIDTAPESKRRVLRAIVAAARELGVHTVAEGIETEAEAGVCVDLGFSHGQGYLFDRPRPLDTL